MKTNLKKYLALLCALALTIGCLPAGVFAANITTGHAAQVGGEQGVYDVELSIGGDSKVMDTDIVLIPYGYATFDEVFFAEAIKLFMPLIQAGSRVRLGVVGMSESGHEVILDMNNDPRAILPNDADAITVLLKEVAADAQKYAGGVNLESTLLTAKEMLAKDTSVPADRKYLFMFNSGMTYFFDNDEGKTSTVPIYGENNVPVWGNLSWMRFRNGSVNSNPGYYLPAAYSSWNEYWADVIKWIEADQDTYVHTVRTTYKNLYNSKIEHKVSSVRYGYTFCEDETPTTAVPYFDSTKAATRNPKTNADAAHAFGYDRGMYEAWLAWEQMNQPAGTTITSVLKDSNGNNKTYEALGFNCYPIYAGSGASNHIGYQFMNMLAGGNVAIYGEGMFSAIASEILDSVAADSYVENTIGSGEGYNFDFVVDAEKLSVDFGGANYKATAIGENTFEFRNTENEKLFELIYNPETDSFKFVTYVTVSNATLNYQVKWQEVPTAEAGGRIYLSNEATLTPVDSEHNEGEKVVLTRPSVINWAATDIEIGNAKEFVEFADVANGKHPFFAGEKHSFVDQIIHLTNDIDLGDYWWYFYDTSVGEEKIDHRIDGFRGIFDGTKNETENYTIYNVKFHAPEGSSKPNESFLSLSMFRTVYGTLQNFNIENVGGYWNDDHTELKPLITGPSTRFFTLAYKTSGALIKNITAKNIDAEMLNPEHISEEMIATDLYTSFNGLLGVVTWESGGTCGNGAYTKVENCHVVDANAVLYNNNQYAGGGFAYKASEMSEFYDCSVDGLTVEIMGNSDNFGGFIGEIGLASLAIRCTVNNIDVTVHGQNNAGMGGFMGDTVGGTGWGDSVHIEDCSVENTTIDVATINAPLGGFVGDLIGGRSAFFERNTVADTVKLIGTNLGAGNGTGYPGVGGFLGGLFGRSNLQANNEHSFKNCSTSAKILAGAAPAGGFVGTALLGSGNQMRVVFDTCAFNGIVNTANTAVAFVGIGDIGTKGTDKNYDEYYNCTVSGALIKGQSPENGQQITLGGDYSYEMEAGDGFSTLESTITQQTTYSEYKNPVEPAPVAPVMYRMMRNVMPAASNDLVKVEFFLDENATEPLHSIERYLNTALDGTNYPALEESPNYALSAEKLEAIFGYMAHEEQLVKVTWFCEDGTEFTADTLVTGDMKVYATLTPVSADVTLESEVTMDGELADGFDVVLNQGEETLQTIPSENGKFTFAPLNFDKIGTYTFTVGQVIGDVETTVYDASVYTVTITVSVENGKIVTDVQFQRNAEAADKVAFENKTISDVNIIVSGNSYMNSEPTDEYEFVLMEGEEIKQDIYAMFGEFFTTLSFQKPGTYTYTLRQVNGEDPTIAYDLSVYTLIVTVVREGNKLVATTQIKLGEETVDTLNFVNKTFDSIDVTLGGNSNLDDEPTGEFQFVLMQGEDILQTIPSENGQFTFAPMNFDQIGTYTFTVSQVTGEDEDIVYDASVYTVVITVQRQDDVLVATTQILLGDETMEQISFSNETVIPETPMDPDGDGMFNVLLVMLVSMALLGTCVVLKRKEN